MNRLGMGLAIGAGYVLGRTKKMKLAFAVGTMVAGKRMHLSPRALADLVSQQLQNNPQFKEVGDQLREDLRGVGKAATGALVERRIEGLADRLHGRTSQVRDQLAAVAPEDSASRGGGDEKRRSSHDAPEDEPRPPRKRAAKKTAAGTAEKAPAKKAPAKKAPAKKTAAKKTARKATRSRAVKGGGRDD